MYSLVIVDDEMEIRSGLYEFAWEEVGFRAVAALPDGKEALAFIETHPVDAVLCDVRMPVMDGLELAGFLSDRKAPPKIVFLSGYKDFEYLRKAIHYRCYDYLLKPTRFSQLVEVFSGLKKNLDDEWARKNARTKHIDAGSGNLLVQSTLDYVRERMRMATLETIADNLQVSPSYLSRVFKEHSGKTFSEYLNAERMKTAAELLKDVRNKTSETAYLVGYSDPKNFTRAFRTYYGVSPREYRSRLKSKK